MQYLYISFFNYQEKTIGGKSGNATIAAIVDGAANGEEPEFTMFAPTDAAFAPILELLDSLPEPLTDAQLTNVLLYHITDGRRFSNSVVNRNNPKAIKMMNGGAVISTPESMLIDTSDLNDGLEATIVGPNLKASNGVIHIIDEVLVPSNLLD